MFDPSLIIQPLVTVLAALIPTVGGIIIALIQRHPTPPQPPIPPQYRGILVPPGVVVKRRSSVKMVAVMVVASVATGICGYVIGGRLTPPILVSDELVPDKQTATFSIDLADQEVIVGEGWMFNGETNNKRGCIAFQMTGPGHFDFIITAGRWRRFKNVTSASRADELLQEHVASLQKNPNAKCTLNNILKVQKP
jgi:hypothetical protein